MKLRHYAFIIACAVVVGSIIGWHIDIRDLDFDPGLIVLVPE